VAVQFLTGFDSGGIENAKSSGGTFSVQNSITKHSIVGIPSYALRVNPTTSAVGFVGFGTVAATTGLPAFFTNQFYNSRFYFYIATAPAANSEQIMSCRTTAAGLNWAVRLDSARKLSLYNASNVLVTTGSTVLALNTWYRIEIQADNSGLVGSAVHLLLINGVTEWNTTCAQGTNPGEYCLGKTTNRNSQTMDVYYDDLVLDNSGSLPGEGIVACLTPNNIVNGVFDFNSGTGTSGAPECDETPLDTTTYVMSAASANHNATFNQQLAIAAQVGGTIRAILMTCAGIREDTTGTSDIKAQIKSGSSTQLNSTSLNATTTPSNIAVLSLTDPATGVAWTRAGIDAASFGIIAGASNAIAVRLSAVFVEVCGDFLAVTANPASVAVAAPTVSATGAANAAAPAATVTLSTPDASATGNAAATASAATVTVTAPTAVASVNVSASASAATVTVTAPTATATGDANTTADAATVTVTAPTATATGDANTTADAATVTVGAPTASATGGASATADAATVTVTPPTATADGGASGAITGGFDVAAPAPSLSFSGSVVNPSRAHGGSSGSPHRRKHAHHKRHKRPTAPAPIMGASSVSAHAPRLAFHGYVSRPVDRAPPTEPPETQPSTPRRITGRFDVVAPGWHVQKRGKFDQWGDQIIADAIAMVEALELSNDRT
jgi:hypothetical protein